MDTTCSGSNTRLTLTPLLKSLELLAIQTTIQQPADTTLELFEPFIFIIVSDKCEFVRLILTQLKFFNLDVEAVIALPVAYSDSPLVNEQGIASGFGLTSADSLIWTDHLNPQSTYQRVISEFTCKSMLGANSNLVTSSHFCAFDDEDHARVCFGDEGAGLVVDVKRVSTIVGVLSRVVNLCQGDEPAIYTRVAPYVDWIRAVALM